MKHKVKGFLGLYLGTILEVDLNVGSPCFFCPGWGGLGFLWLGTNLSGNGSYIRTS